MILSVAQLAKLRRYLGVYEARFTDDQLQEFVDDAYEVNPLTWFEGAISEAFYTLALAAAELTDFKQGETSESESVIYTRLWNAHLLWSNKAGYNSLPTFELRQIPLEYIDFNHDSIYNSLDS